MTPPGRRPPPHRTVLPTAIAIVALRVRACLRGTQQPTLRCAIHDEAVIETPRPRGLHLTEWASRTLRHGVRLALRRPARLTEDDAPHAPAFFSQ